MVNWSIPATNDLKQIHDYIAKDSKYYARRAIQDIVEKTENIADFPETGRVVPEIFDIKNNKSTTNTHCPAIC